MTLNRGSKGGGCTVVSLVNEGGMEACDHVVGIAVGAIIVARKKRSDLIPPIALAVVGIHFFPLAPVFGQPILYVVAALVTIAAVVAAFPPLKIAARSFWCGILAGPVFLTAGAVSFFAANSVL